MDREQNLYRSGITRRQFLTGAVMGLTVAYLAPKASYTQQEDEIDVTVGIATALASEWVEIENSAGLKRMWIKGDTSVWKGGERPLSAIVKGDKLMIRFLTPEDVALRMWSNLTRIQGVVARVVKNGYVLRTSSHRAPPEELFLEIAEGVTFTDYFTYGSLPVGGPVIMEGDSLDVIGEQITEGIRGTLISVYSAQRMRAAGDTQPPRQGADQVEVGPDALCWYTYAGYAGWFDCSYHAGRCQTCDPARSDQAAWPAFDTCGCCSSSCCDCSRNCKNQIYASCGKGVTVYDKCSTKIKTVYIASCGPCQKANCSGCSPELCSRTCSDCSARTGAVIDLTKPTFAYFYDPASRGCFSCDAKIQSICP